MKPISADSLYHIVLDSIGFSPNEFMNFTTKVPKVSSVHIYTVDIIRGTYPNAPELLLRVTPPTQ